MENEIKNESNVNSKMGYAPLNKLIISMAIPSMFSMIISALYNIVDSIFVSWISEDALNALSLANPFQLLVPAVAVGTSIGVNSLISRKLGAKKIKEASLVASHGFLLIIISWVVFLIIGLFFSRPFFCLYTNDPEIINMGSAYLSCVLIFSIGLFIQIITEKIFQSTGNMICPMFIQLTGAVANIILDPIFIFVFNMGVIGAAIATVLGQILGALLAIYLLKTKMTILNINFKNLKFDKKIIIDIYKVGFPSIIMQSISSFSLFFINGILGTIKELYVTIFGIYFKLQSFIFMPTFGINHSVLPIIAYNYGAKNKKRIFSAIKWGILYALIIMLIGTLLFWIIPEQLISMFNASDELKNIGAYSFNIISLLFIPAAFSIIFTATFQAVGKGFHSLTISLIRQVCVLVPIVYIFSKTLPEYVWFAFPIAEIIGFIYAFILFIFLAKNINKAFKNNN